MNKKLLYKIHVWLSLPLGILITVICLSGATLVFKNEIRNALGLPRVVAPHGMGKGGQSADATTDKTRQNHYASNENTAKPAHKSHHADSPYGTTTKRDFFSYVTKFHTGLMIGKSGKLIVTYTTLVFVVILISGVCICLPKNGRQLKQRFAIAHSKGTRRLLYDLHVSLGWWTILWLLLLAVTGVAFGLKLIPRGSELMTIFHQLHIGAWGGITTKIITFIASLVGASLPITGYWLYFKKHR